MHTGKIEHTIHYLAMLDQSDPSREAVSIPKVTRTPPNIIRAFASSWAMMFALVHVYWLAGGGVGLPPSVAAARPPMIMLAAAIAVPLLALAALGPLVGPGSASPRIRQLAKTGVAIVALFSLAHALPPLVQAAGLALMGQLRMDQATAYSLMLYEPNWLLGGILFAAVWRTWPKRAPGPRTKGDDLRSGA